MGDSLSNIKQGYPALELIAKPENADKEVTVDVTLRLVFDMTCGPWAADSDKAREAIAENVADWVLQASAGGEDVVMLAGCVELDELCILEGPKDG